MCVITDLLNPALFCRLHESNIMNDEISIDFNEVDEAIRCILSGDKNVFAVVIQEYNVQIRAMIGAQHESMKAWKYESMKAWKHESMKH